MKLICFYFSLIVHLLYSRDCFSQNTNSDTTETTNYFVPNTIPFKEVELNISIDHAGLSIGSTNVLKCIIRNHSKSKIIIYATSKAPAFVFLTNSTGSFYLLSGEQKIESHNHPFQTIPPVFWKEIAPNQVFSWNQEFVIVADIPLGEYQLKANQFVLTSGLRYASKISSEIPYIRIVKEAGRNIDTNLKQK